MISGRTVLGLIPARGGSKRILNKNLRKFGEFNLVEIAFRVSRQSKYIDRILVSSDSAEILSTVPKEFQLPRPAHLSTDCATSESVALHALSLYPADLLVLLQPTSPLRTAADIDACIELAVFHGACISYGPAGKNGALYVTGPTCNYHSPHHQYLMPAHHSLDINTEDDLKQLTESQAAR